jgi:hypothetical protein
LRAYGTNEYYENGLKDHRFNSDTGLTGLVISDLPWYEIDDVQDLDIAETIFFRTGYEA